MLQTFPASIFIVVLIVTPVSRSAPPDTAPLSQSFKESPLRTRQYWGPARETGEGTEEKECIGLWQKEGENGTCECGAQIHGAVYCDNSTVSVLDCYCMTEESTTGQMVVGNCIYNCLNLSKKIDYSDIFYHPVPSLCDYLHRTGTLCGQCNYTDHHFPPAYSYDVKCVKCEQSDSVWLYIAVAFLPLTVFIVVILVFRVDVVYPKLHAFVCFAQIAGSPIQVRIFLLSTTHTGTAISVITKIVASLYGFWNLDFFRTLIPRVCLHLTTMHVLALDYLIAVYPMALMVFAYVLTELHAHGFRPVLLLWKPFHYISARFRREWDIQSSLVDAFVTFFILSSTKLFSVSFDLLIPTTLYVATGDEFGTYLYYDPNIEYMRHRSGHLYYGLLAISVLLVFVVLPIAVLVFSTCKRTENMYRIRVLNEFLHSFQRYYKDGSDGTRDCRWYAALQNISLLGIYVMYAIVKTEFLYNLATLYYMLVAIIVLLVEPYKTEYAVYNILDCALYLWHAMFAVALDTLNLSSDLQREYIAMGYASIIFVAVTPLVLVSSIVVRWLLTVIGCKKRKSSELQDDETSLAHRITNSQEYKDSCGYVTTLHTQEIIESDR